jgi:hypothetical protein
VQFDDRKPERGCEATQCLESLESRGDAVMREIVRLCMTVGK